MDILKGIINEIKKFKRTGILAMTIMSSIVFISFQGLLGLIASSVDETNIYVTALSLYFRLFLPVILSLFISISFYNEKKASGILMYYYHAVSLTKVFRNKIWTFYIQGIAVYIFCMGFAMFFITLEGGNPFIYVINNYNGVLYSVVGIMILTNIQLLLVTLSDNPILSLLVALVCAIGNFFVASTNLWLFFPWSYPYRMLYHTSVSSDQIIILIVILVISFLALLLSKHKFEKNMLFG
ncbi:ABC transporter permease [Gracilibacillus xinjiangensis]|uniref:ABC transporter permease n=1 Tax=Gracilibacillus xinjiangensis TaxID=1193282 RepID=A0ABV8WWS3_9BACI